MKYGVIIICAKIIAMTQSRTVFLFLSIFFLVNCSEPDSAELTIYVSKDGTQENDGSINSPLPDLQSARDRIRELQSDSPELSRINVSIREGDYEISETFRLNSQDSGTPDTKIVYSAYHNEKVRLLGGKVLSNDLVDEADTRELSSLVDKTILSKVKVIDLKKLKLDDPGRIIQHGFSTAILPSQMEFFINHKPQTIARWPNNDRVRIDKVYEVGSKSIEGNFDVVKPIIGYSTDRQDNWINANDVWLSGYFMAGYADDNLPVLAIDTLDNKIILGKPHMFGVGESDPNSEWGGKIRGYYAYNLLEELDQPEEYFIDRKAMKLYYIPSSDDPQQELAISVLEDPIISLKNVSNVSIKNITIEYGRGMGIYIEGGENCTFENLEVSNFGTVAMMMGKGVSGVDMPIHEFTGKLTSETVGNLKAHNYENTGFSNKAGKNHKIINCHFYNLGAGGMILSGGDRASLEIGNNIVEGSEIHDFNRRYKTYCAGITLFGVGNQIRKTKIYNAPHQGIAIFGNEHLIEFNLLTNLVKDVHDNGAIYIGRNPSERGNIIRHNFFINNGTEGFKNCAIHIDDHASDVEVFGNVFYRTSKSDFGDVLINGGSNNSIKNNLFIEGSHSIWVEDPAIAGNPFFVNNKAYKEGGIIHKRLTQDINIFTDVWKNSYPELAELLSKDDIALKGNRFSNNVIVDSKFIVSKHGFDSTVFVEFENNLIFKQNPGFSDYKNFDFSLTKESIVYEKNEDFLTIPFDSIPDYSSISDKIH
jgi:hypothetical protein